MNNIEDAGIVFRNITKRYGTTAARPGRQGHQL